MRKVSVPMRFPLRKMPKLPESTTREGFASFRLFSSWPAPKQSVAARTTAKKTANLVCFTVLPPDFEQSRASHKFPRPRHPPLFPWFQRETAPSRTLRGGFQKVPRSDEHTSEL